MLRGLSVRGMFKNSKHWNFPCAWWCVANHRARSLKSASLPCRLMFMKWFSARARCPWACGDQPRSATDNDI